MKYQQVKHLRAAEFRRLTGVKPATFQQMVEVVREAEAQRKVGVHQRGRKPTLTIEDQVLLMLDYYREYRTLFHVGVSYGVSESSASRITRTIEARLIKSGQFRLPGKKALLESNTEWEVVLIDASETPIERPKKNSATSTAARRNAIR